MGNSIRKRNSGVELARIIASLIVIGCHVYPEAIFNASRTLIAMFFSDGVAVFWFILGFYLFNNTDQKKLLKHTFKRVVIPSAIILVVTFYFRSWISGKASLAECLMKSKEDYYEFFHSLITWNAYDPCNHLWYVYIYVIIIALYPLLKQAVNLIDSDKKYKKYFVIATLVLILANDLLHNQLLDFSHHTIGGLIPAMIQVVWGHLVYEKVKDIKKLKYAFLALGVFIVVNIIRFLVGWNEIAEVINWYNLCGIISAICILIFAFSVSNCIKNEKALKTINYLGSLTYPVYLIHMLVLSLLSRYHVGGRLAAVTMDSHTGIGAEIVYTLGMLFIAASVSFAFAVLIDRIIYLFKHFLSREDA